MYIESLLCFDKVNSFKDKAIIVKAINASMGLWLMEKTPKYAKAYGKLWPNVNAVIVFIRPIEVVAINLNKRTTTK